MAERETLPLSTLLGTTAVIVAVTAALAYLIPAAYRAHEDELRAERGWSSTPADTRQTRASQADRLAHYAWIDKPKGVVALPIERAMELTVQELGKPANGQGGGR